MTRNVAAISTNVQNGGVCISWKIDPRQRKKATNENAKRMRRCGASRLARP
ncbi:hypothetical protein D3C83_85900 [compost metagenome]